MKVKMTRTLKVIAAIGLSFWLSLATTPSRAESDPIVGKPLTLDQYFKRKAPTAKRAPAVHAAIHKDKLAKITPRPAAKTNDKDTATQDDTVTMPSSLPDSVANANAKLSIGDIDPNQRVKAVVDTIADVGSRPIETVSGIQIAFADQFNDIDRASMDDTAATSIAPAVVTATSQLSRQAIMSIGSREEAWQPATLIGKIMVSFGLILMVGSTIRMIFA